MSKMSIWGKEKSVSRFEHWLTVALAAFISGFFSSFWLDTEVDDSVKEIKVINEKSCQIVTEAQDDILWQDGQEVFICRDRDIRGEKRRGWNAMLAGEECLEFVKPVTTLVRKGFLTKADMKIMGVDSRGMPVKVSLVIDGEDVQRVISVISLVANNYQEKKENMNEVE